MSRRNDIVLISPFFFDLVTGVMGVIFVLFVISSSAGLDIQKDEISQLSIEQLAYLDHEEVKKTNFILELATNPTNDLILDERLVPENFQIIYSEYPQKKYTVIADIPNDPTSTYDFILNVSPNSNIKIDLFADKHITEEQRFSQKNVQISISKLLGVYSLNLEN